MSGKPWSKEEIKLLRRIYPFSRGKQLDSYFPGRTHGSITQQALRLGIKHIASSWSDFEKSFLKRYYSKLPWESLCRNLNRSRETITAYACKLGLHRSRQWKRTEPHKRKSRPYWRKHFIKKLGHKCRICDWDKTVEINHIDGNRNNWEDSNIEVLCPNHHSITPTHAHQGNNGSKYKIG